MGRWLGFQGPLAPLLPVQDRKGPSRVQSVIKSQDYSHAMGKIVASL